MVNNKILLALSLLIFLSNCKEKQENFPLNTIQYKDFRNAEELRSMVESFYIHNDQTLPKSEKQLKEFYQDSIDYFFENQDSPLGRIHYIPVLNNPNDKPEEYFLVTDNENVISLSQTDINSFLNNLVTICEYNKGNKKDLLLTYGNPYLISSGRLAKTLKESLYPQWKDRVFYNVIFDIDSTAVLSNQDLNFTIQKDTITINGTFFNVRVKNKILDELQKKNNVKLQGFKTKNISEKEIVLKDVVLKIKRDSIFSKYFNEVGELEDYKHIRECDLVTN